MDGLRGVFVPAVALMVILNFACAGRRQSLISALFINRNLLSGSSILKQWLKLAGRAN